MPNKGNESRTEEIQRPFYFTIVSVFLIIAVIAYLGIFAYNNFFLKKQLEDAQRKNTELQEKISQSSASAENFSQIVAVVAKGKSIQSILLAHPYMSKIYALLEGATIKNLSYNKFSAKISEDNTVSVTIAGEAESYRALARQLTLFQKSKEIKEVIFKEAQQSKNGKTSFSVDLIFNSNSIISSK